MLVFEFDEGDGPELDVADFLESLEALEDGSEVALLRLVRDVLHEERLVGSHVFVGDEGSAGLCARLLRCRRVGLRLCVFLRALEIYSRVSYMCGSSREDVYPSA